MLRRLAGSRKKQGSLYALWIFKCEVTLVLVSNKTQMRVATIFPVNKYYLFVASAYTCNLCITIEQETDYFRLHAKHQISKQ